MARQIEEIILKVSVDDRQANSRLDRFSASASKAQSSAGGLSKSIKFAGAAIAALGLKKLAAESLDVALKFDKIDNALKSVLGSQTAVNREFEFLSGLSDELGLSLSGTAEAYSKVAAAARGTSIEGKGTRDIIQGVSEAATSLGLSADETSGALRAINQIISKGKVQAEELRGQLGERIPGAFQIAARAMGVTTQELDKMLETGSLLSEDFIPKFARQLSTEFAGSAKDASNSIQANMNRLRNEWERSLSGMGEAVGKLLPVLTSLLTSANDLGSAVMETADGFNLWADEILGLTKADEGLTQVELDRLRIQKMNQQEAKANARAMKQEKDAADQLSETMKKLSAINQLGMDIFNAEALQDIRAELQLTESEFTRLEPAIMNALSQGVNTDALKDSIKSFVSAFKDQLNEIEAVDVDLSTPFDKLIKDATQFNQALDLSKTLGLTEKEFKKVNGAIQQALDKNIDPNDIAAKLEGLRSLGFFDDVKAQADTTRASSTPVTSAFEVGTASASEFLQSTKLNEERNKLLGEIRDAVKKRNENPPVSIVTRGNGL